MRKLDARLLGYMSVFERLTRTEAKDLFLSENGEVIFVVNEGRIGKALGKGGNNIKKLSGLIKKKVRVIEFSDRIEKFIRNIVMPIEVRSIEVEDSNILIDAGSSQNKAMLLGRNKSRLKEMNSIVKKYFKFDVKVR